MKKTVLFLGAVALALTSGVNAELRIYGDKETFEKEEGQYCVAATDGCNNFMMQDGKVIGGTKMFCEGHTEKWSCTEYQEGIVTTLGLTETTSIENNNSITGKIVDIYNGKDGKQIYIMDDNSKVYSTAVSVINDTITDGEYSDLKLGAEVKVFYTNELEDNNILIGDNLEFVSKTNMSENDLNFHDTIMDRLDGKYISRVENTIKKYNSLTSQLSNSKKQSLKNSLINKVDEYLYEIVMPVPQDIKMPDNVNNVYLTLNLLKLKLQIQ